MKKLENRSLEAVDAITKKIIDQEKEIEVEAISCFFEVRKSSEFIVLNQHGNNVYSD